MSAVMPKSKSSIVSVSISKRISTWVEDDVDVDLEDIKEEDMAEYLRSKGYYVVAPGDTLEGSYEDRLFRALHIGEGDLRRIVEDMLYDRLGRIA